MERERNELTWMQVERQKERERQNEKLTDSRTFQSEPRRPSPPAKAATISPFKRKGAQHDARKDPLRLTVTRKFEGAARLVERD